MPVLFRVLRLLLTFVMIRQIRSSRMAGALLLDAGRRALVLGTRHDPVARSARLVGRMQR